MTQAETFNFVMMSLWDEQDVPMEAVAIASYVKSHGRRNHENAFDVLDIMWPESVKGFRGAETPNMLLCDVTFPDGSRAMIEAPDGIGSSIELVS